jgi:DegV family protein with EDD domain
MTKIALITDSTCCIPEKMLKQYEIYVAPNHVIWGTEDLLDTVDITPQQFYERLIIDPVHPTTSQVPVVAFVDCIDQAKKAGATQIFIATVSEPLSGTYSCAIQAAEPAGIPIHVHDSRSVAMGLGWQVIGAARARDNGADLEGMAEAAENVRKHLAVMLTVDTLEFLHRGGRIGGAAKLIGTALNIKPQLIVDPESGTVLAGERTRTRSRAVEATYQAFLKKMDTSRPLHFAVHHAKAPEDADAMAARFKTEFPSAEVVTTEITPVLGVHGGPGTLALCGYYEAQTDHELAHA